MAHFRRRWPADLRNVTWGEDCSCLLFLSMAGRGTLADGAQKCAYLCIRDMVTWLFLVSVMKYESSGNGCWEDEPAHEVKSCSLALDRAVGSCLASKVSANGYSCPRFNKTPNTVLRISLSFCWPTWSLVCHMFCFQRKAINYWC